MNTLRQYIDIIGQLDERITINPDGTTSGKIAPAPAAAPAGLTNPWEGKDPAKAQAWAKLSPQLQQKMGMADPTDNIIISNNVRGGFLFGKPVTDANPDGTPKTPAAAPASTSAAAPTGDGDGMLAPAATPTSTANAVAASGQPDDATGVDAAVAAQSAQTPPAQAGQPANRDSMTFGQAFKDARDKKEPKFTWKGKEYTTQLAPASPANTPTTDKPTTDKPTVKVGIKNPGTTALQNWLNTNGVKVTVDGKWGGETQGALDKLRALKPAEFGTGGTRSQEMMDMVGVGAAHNVKPAPGKDYVWLNSPRYLEAMKKYGYDPKTGNSTGSAAPAGTNSTSQSGMPAPAAQEPANAAELRTKRDAYGKAYVAMKNNPSTPPAALAQMEKNLTDIVAQMKAAGISETVGYSEDQNLASIVHLAGLK
jgi:hypothetical protein